MIKKMEHPTEKELTEIITLWLISNEQAHPFIPKNYWSQQLPMVKEMMQEAVFYTIFIKEHLVGFVGLQENYIAGIFIETKYQRQGLGKQLLEMIKKDYEVLELFVYAKNRQALRFYKAQGFTIAKSQTDQLGEKEYQMIWQKAE